jgi:hypothetical protein
MNRELDRELHHLRDIGYIDIDGQGSTCLTTHSPSSTFPSEKKGRLKFLYSNRLERLAAASDHARPYPKFTRAWGLYLHGPEFVDLVTDTRLAQPLDALLGTDHLLSDLSLNSVNPGQPIDDWYIDYPFNEMPQLVHGSVLGVQCVLTLSQFTELTVRVPPN